MIIHAGCGFAVVCNVHSVSKGVRDGAGKSRIYNLNINIGMVSKGL